MASNSKVENALLGIPVDNCISLLRLLHAADCFPRGGLYVGYYALAAAMRYEGFWLEFIHCGNPEAAPPLDIAFAWFVHRQDPAIYQHNLASRGCTGNIHPPPKQAFTFGFRLIDITLWQAAAGKHPVWPPPAPGSDYDPLALPNPTFAVRLAGFMSRFSLLLLSWLRPHFLDANFLRRAQERYGRFLSLHAAHPNVLLVPPADVALVWHTHLGLSGEYAAACQALFGAWVPSWRPDYLELSPDKLWEAYALSAKLYMEMYGEPFVDRDTAWLPNTVPYPLAAPNSPIAWALRAFDENPQDSEQRPALLAAAARTGLPLVDLPVVRSGAHALFAAWLAAQQSDDVYTAETCNGFCCWTKSVSVAALRHSAAVLVSVAYFLQLPDTDSHPYITSIKLRKSLWIPATLEGATTTTLQGFSPFDAVTYLSACESQYLRGLAALLWPARIKFGESESPLWIILSQRGMPKRAAALHGAAWQAAAERGVSTMLLEYKLQYIRVSNRSCIYYASTDYYLNISSYYLNMAAYWEVDNTTVIDCGGDGGGCGGGGCGGGGCGGCGG